jgi:hypothetical protein
LAFCGNIVGVHRFLYLIIATVNKTHNASSEKLSGDAGVALQPSLTVAERIVEL